MLKILAVSATNVGKALRFRILWSSRFLWDMNMNFILWGVLNYNDRLGYKFRVQKSEQLLPDEVCKYRPVLLQFTPVLRRG